MFGESNSIPTLPADYFVKLEQVSIFSICHQVDLVKQKGAQF